MATTLPAMNRPLSDLAFVVGLIGLVPMAVFSGLRLLRSWRWIAGVALALVAILTYLATDDPAIVHPVTFEQISPAFPGAEASYQVLMRYGKNHPLGQNFKEAKRIFDAGPFVDSSKPAEWPDWLTRHRAAIEADWAELAPVRAWIDELNGFERIGDVMPAQPDAEIITFGPFRSYTHHVCEIAGLQAIAGKGDEAIATLLPLIQVSRKLEPSSRSLVRSMVARVMQGIALETTRFVLDTTKVSPAMREQLAAAFTLGIGGEAGVRHLLGIDYAFFPEAGAGRALGDFIPHETGRSELVRGFLNLTSPFLYNPCRTANLHGEFVANLQEAAARRDLKEFDRVQAAFFRTQTRPGFKNFMGRYLLSAMVPAYTKVVNAYWRIEDHRTALLARP